MRKLLILIPSPQHWRLIINLGCPNDRSKYYPRCSREYSILGERDYMITWSWNVLKESIQKPYQNIEDNWAVFKTFQCPLLSIRDGWSIGFPTSWHGKMRRPLGNHEVPMGQEEKTNGTNHQPTIIYQSYPHPLKVKIPIWKKVVQCPLKTIVWPTSKDLEHVLTNFTYSWWLKPI